MGKSKDGRQKMFAQKRETIDCAGRATEATLARQLVDVPTLGLHYLSCLNCSLTDQSFSPPIVLEAYGPLQASVAAERFFDFEV
jgi:hypothetical protein